jgi:hypothetical protein
MDHKIYDTDAICSVVESWPCRIEEIELLSSLIPKSTVITPYIYISGRENTGMLLCLIAHMCFLCDISNDQLMQEKLASRSISSVHIMFLMRTWTLTLQTQIARSSRRSTHPSRGNPSPQRTLLLWIP